MHTGIDDITEFERRLRDVIAWCDKHASLSDPMHSLRTVALRPPFLLETQRPDVAGWAVIKAMRLCLYGCDFRGTSHARV